MAIKEIGQGENVIGRSLGDIAKYGKEGTGYLGKVLMSSGEKPVLGSKILVDLAKPHLVLICGKRGGGKSYSMAVLLEEMARVSPTVKQRLSVIVIDTVGIFWSLKIPDKQ